MNLFDKFCAILAFLLGLVFLVLGGLGLFMGCSASFQLPPPLGFVPFLVGWGIVRAVYFGWNPVLIWPPEWGERPARIPGPAPTANAAPVAFVVVLALAVAGLVVYFMAKG